MRSKHQQSGLNTAKKERKESQREITLDDLLAAKPGKAQGKEPVVSGYALPFARPTNLGRARTPKAEVP